jgi:hypothetical protein
LATFQIIPFPKYTPKPIAKALEPGTYLAIIASIGAATRVAF